MKVCADENALLCPSIPPGFLIWGGGCSGYNSTCASDIDGNIYEIVQIGNQKWMKENLGNLDFS